MATDAQAQAKQRLAVNVPEQLHTQAKSKAAAQGRTLTDVVIDLLKRFVSK